MEKAKPTRWIKIILSVLLLLAGLTPCFTALLISFDAKVQGGYSEQKEQDEGWVNGIILEDKIGTEESPYLSCEEQEKRILVTTPYYTFVVPVSWAGHCKIVAAPDAERYLDWIPEEAYTPKSSRDPGIYEIRIYHYSIKGEQTLLASVCMYYEILNWHEKDSHKTDSEYIGLLNHETNDGKTHRIHFFYEESDEWIREDSFYDMRRDLSDVLDSIEIRTDPDDGSRISIDREHSAYSEFMDHFRNEYLWRNTYYNVPLPHAYYVQLEKEKQEALEKERQEKILEEKKRAQQRSENARPSKSEYKMDPYDVYDFDDPDDFADHWAEEFEDEWSDEDEAWDDAYDYWEEHH